MEFSPSSEDISGSITQEFPNILLNLVQKSQILLPVMRQANPSTPFHVISLISILICQVFPSYVFLSRISNKTLYTSLLSFMRTARPAISSL
jgi:hypothetical protein